MLIYCAQFFNHYQVLVNSNSLFLILFLIYENRIQTTDILYIYNYYLQIQPTIMLITSKQLLVEDQACDLSATYLSLLSLLHVVCDNFCVRLQYNNIVILVMTVNNSSLSSPVSGLSTGLQQCTLTFSLRVRTNLKRSIYKLLYFRSNMLPVLIEIYI